MTTSIGITEPRQSSFKGYLLWYTLVQCCFAVGVFTVAAIYGFAMGYFGFADPAEIEAQMAALDIPFRILSVIICIILAIAVASRHGVRFGAGFGGYWLGNILTLVVTAPLLFGLEPAVAALSYPADLMLLVGADLAYIVSLTIIVVVLRRRSSRLGSEREIIERFD